MAVVVYLILYVNKNIMLHKNYTYAICLSVKLSLTMTTLSAGLGGCGGV